MLKFIIVLIIILSNLLVCSPIWALAKNNIVPEEEKLFQIKANLLINNLANLTQIPAKGDIEKYVWPQVIAHLAKNQNDDWAKKQLKKFTNKSEKNFYTNRDAFASPGITRLLYLYPNNPTIKQSQKKYLEYINPNKSQKKNYNFWVTGGTENFVNMLRTSGYLLADLAVKQGDTNFLVERNKKAQWILNKVKKTYEVGAAEWDSSTYTTYNLIGWLNLYDFADDPLIKNAAQAMLDYYSATIALKYSHGVYGGAEQRGGAANSSFNSITDYLAWLWFSNYIPPQKDFFKWSAYLPTIHAATSTYRPPLEAIILARKANNSNEYYRNYKSNYDLAALEFPEFFYLGNNYTLGSVIAPRSEQLVNWKLVAFSPSKEDESLVITGGNSYYQKKFNGEGKTIFDTYFQAKNILIQLTYLPPNLKQEINRQNLRNWLNSLITQIKCGNTCQFALKNKLNKIINHQVYPISRSKEKNLLSNYLSLPNQTLINQQTGIYFVQVNNIHLAITPLNQKVTITKGNLQKIPRFILENQGELGEVIGFIIEIGENNFADFQKEIINRTQVNINQAKIPIIQYTASDGRNITIQPRLNNFLPYVTINNKLIDFKAGNNYLYNGKSLTVKDYILKLTSPQSIYEINYQGNKPIFSRKYLQ